MQNYTLRFNELSYQLISKVVLSILLLIFPFQITQAEEVNTYTSFIDTPISTIQELRSLDPEQTYALLLHETEGLVLYKWQSSDLSTEVYSSTGLNEFVASNMDVTGKHGAWVKNTENGIRTSVHGVTGKSDLRAMLTIGALSNLLDVPIIIDVPAIDLTGRTSITEMVQVNKGIIVERESQLTYDGFGIPVFIGIGLNSFSLSGKTLTLLSAVENDPTESTPTSLSKFEEAIGKKFGFAGVNHQTLTKSVLCLLDSKNIFIENLKFRGKDELSNNIFNAIYIGRLFDGRSLTENVTIKNWIISDFVYGLNSSNFKNLTIDTVHAGDYFPFIKNPGHVVYISSDNDVVQQSENILIKNVFDHGRAKKHTTVVAETTLKILRTKNLTIKDTESYRQGGAVEIGNIQGGVIGFKAFRKDSTPERRSRYAFRDISIERSSDFPAENVIVNGEIWASGVSDDRWFELNRALSSGERRNNTYNFKLYYYNSSVNGFPIIGFAKNSHFNIVLEREELSPRDTLLTLVDVVNSTIVITHNSAHSIQVRSNKNSENNAIIEIRDYCLHCNP